MFRVTGPRGGSGSSSDPRMGGDPTATGKMVWAHSQNGQKMSFHLRSSKTVLPASPGSKQTNPNNNFNTLKS